MRIWTWIPLITMSLLATLGAMPRTAAAQYVGISSFAAMSQRFPCEAFLATSDFSSRPAMSVLWGTFGDDPTCLSRFTSRYHDKPHLVQFHFSNESCRRNGNCEFGELRPDLNRREYSAALERKDPALLGTIRDRIKNIRAVAESIRNPNTYLVISAGLEDNYTPAAFVALVEELQREWPYLIVRSGSTFVTFPREQHGLNAACGNTTIVANVDGGVGRLKDEQRFLRRNAGRCLATFLWHSKLQGRGPGNRWIPPSQRIFNWNASDVIRNGRLLHEATK